MRSRLLQRANHGSHALVVETHRLLDGRLLRVVRLVRRVWILGRPVGLDEPGQRIPREPLVMAQVATSDQRSIRVGAQPVATAPQELVDLALADPVVLVVVEHRQQHEHLLQHVPQAGRGR